MATIRNFAEDPGHYVFRRNAVYLGFKQVLKEIAKFFGEALSAGTAGQASALFAGISSHTLTGLMMVGGTGAISAGLAQWDYLRELAKVKAFFKGQGVGDNNHVVAKKTKQLKRERTIGVVLSFVASVAAIAAVHFGVPAIAEHAFGIHHLAHFALFDPSSWTNAASLGNLAINSAVGLGVYNGVKLGLYWLGDKMLGLHKETAYDQLVELQHEREAGKAISIEQVKEVFTTTYPELERASPAQARKLIPLLDRLTGDINAGIMDIAGLARAIENEAPIRHARTAPKKHGTIYHTLMKLDKKLSFRHPKTAFVGMKLEPQESVRATAYAEVETKSGDYHVRRLGRAKFDASMGHARLLEQLEQLEQQNAPSTQTLQ